jgi:hypothetical protein
MSSAATGGAGTEGPPDGSLAMLSSIVELTSGEDLNKLAKAILQYQALYTTAVQPFMIVLAILETRLDRVKKVKLYIELKKEAGEADRAYMALYNQYVMKPIETAVYARPPRGGYRKTHRRHKRKHYRHRKTHRRH